MERSAMLGRGRSEWLRPGDSLLESKLFVNPRLDFQGIGVYPSDDFGDRRRYAARPSVHRQDEPARLSLGMVASQQSPLLFHPAIDFTSN
jgi:hypothetical protein